ncbi:MAG: FAD-dependent oxidoreductase [Terrimicrobiaceae bacterium]
MIGAGVAGLSAAARATESGLSVAVVEKSRGVGGRAATRRINEFPVDHGAQFFTAREPTFQAKVREWEGRGLCHVWSYGIPTWENGVIHEPQEGHPRHVCSDGMTSLAKHEAQGLAVFRESTVTECRRENDRWVLQAKEGGTWAARTVLSTAPAPQTLSLFERWVPADDPLRQLQYAPCLCCIFEVPGFRPKWKGLQCRHPDVSWIAWDATRRRTSDSPYFVVHGSPEFSRSHLEDDPKVAVQALQSVVAVIAGEAFASATMVHAHRWRYARVENPRPETHRALTENLLFAGDAFLHANVESAWLSGRAAASAVRA